MTITFEPTYGSGPEASDVEVAAAVAAEAAARDAAIVTERSASRAQTNVSSINKVVVTAPATSATLTLIDGTTVTGPAATGTLATLGNAETVTGVKTFGSAGAVSKLKIAGTTSGAATLDAPAVAGSIVVTLPATTGTLVHAVDVAALITAQVKVKEWTQVSPTNAENQTILYFTRAATLTAIRGVIRGSTSCTVVLKHGADRSASGTTVSTQTISNTTGGAAATISDGVIAAGDYLWVTTTALVGTPDEVSVTVEYTGG